MGAILNDIEAKNAKPKDKAYNLTVSRGLYLNVLPSGKKFFRCRVTDENGKKVWRTLGDYPEMSLKEARARLEEIRGREAQGLPVKEPTRQTNTFVRAAEAYVRHRETTQVSRKTIRNENSILRRFVLPAIGEMELETITPRIIMDMLTQIMDDVSAKTALYAKNITSHIFKFAAMLGMTTFDPCSILRGVIKEPPKKHHASVRDPRAIGEVLRKINAIPQRQTRLAIIFLVYTFCRTGEVCFAEWADIDMRRKELRIPAERMKMRRPHIVPLSKQMISLLKTMRGLTGNRRFIFPQEIGRDNDKPMGASTISKSLMRNGVPKETTTPHGFRAMASTILNENGFNSDWIERQLAHIERNRVRAAYNYADYLKDRVKMMQWYADYLDGLRGEPIDLE